MYIELKNMVFYAYHGVMEQEKKVGNVFVVDLKLYLDLRNAMRSDRLEDTLNYAAVFDVVKEEMSIPSNLLEYVAGRIIRSLKQTFPQIRKVEIRVAKTNPPVAGEAGEAAVGITD